MDLRSDPIDCLKADLDWGVLGKAPELRSRTYRIRCSFTLSCKLVNFKHVEIVTYMPQILFAGYDCSMLQGLDRFGVVTRV